MHAQTRKRELIDIIHDSGLSISYDRVLSISTDVGNKICDTYHKNGVCPPSMRKGLFTTAQVDNIDHNPSSSTAITSFHGTAISVFQHPTFFDDGSKIVHADASKQTNICYNQRATCRVCNSVTDFCKVEKQSTTTFKRGSNKAL